jgi:hypothetical protein
VIESATVQLNVPLGQNVLFARIDTNLCPSACFSLVLTLTHPGTAPVTGGQLGEIFTGTHRVFAVFEPGTVVKPTAVRNSGTGTGDVFMSISGYLVNVP